MPHSTHNTPTPTPTCTLRPPQVIRELLDVDKYVIVVEHDLSVLDYLSDFICCLYGKPGAYGVVTLPFGVRWVLGGITTSLRHAPPPLPAGVLV
jgi:translation initiation factor RLI1